MKIIRSFAHVVILIAMCQVLGCGSPPPVDKPANKVNNANFSPAHKALVEQRKKQDGE